jgi:hypothetical protein
MPSGNQIHYETLNPEDDAMMEDSAFDEEDAMIQAAMDEDDIIDSDKEELGEDRAYDGYDYIAREYDRDIDIPF